MAPPLFDMHATWCYKNMPGYDGFIEAEKKSWLWFAKLNDKKALITVFTEPKHFLKSETNRLEEHYFEMLKHFSLLKACELDHVKGKIEGCDAGSRYSSDPVGMNFIRVGDANIKVDPIASQGVHLAMLSALQAAVVVNTILKKPENNSYAIDFYRSRQEERVNQFMTKTASAYRQVTTYIADPFWLDRSGYIETEEAKPGIKITLPDESATVKLSAQTYIKSIPVMQEDLITSSPTIQHPSLDRPIAYLGGHDIVSLLTEVRQGKTVSDLIKVWSYKMPPDRAFEIFSWLWSKGIIVSYENCTSKKQL
jgi:hypothetical protein